MSSAYNSTRKKRQGLLCCFLALLRKSWKKFWISEFVKLELSFLRNRRARLGSYFSRTQLFNCCFCETLEYLVILWTFLCLDSCIISVGGTSLLTKVWIIVFLPLWFGKFGPSPAFCAIVFIKVLSLFTLHGAFLNQGLPEPDFTLFTVL